MHLSLPVASAAVRSIVVDPLFVTAHIVCRGSVTSVFGLCFVMQCLVPFQIFQSSQ